MNKLFSYFKNRKLGVIQYILIALILISIITLIISQIHPNYSYKTLEHHVVAQEDEHTQYLSLEPGNVISFIFHSGKSGLNGIQPCFSRIPGTNPDGMIVIDAYNADTYPEDGCYLGQAVTQLVGDLDEAYSYAEFSNETPLKGDIRFEIRYEAGSDASVYPYLVISDKEFTGVDSITVFGPTDRSESEMHDIQGTPFMYYVKIVKTYPLVFDSRVLLAICIALLCIFPGKRESGSTRTIQKGFGIELPFFIVSMVLGLILIYLTGTNQISYDEQTHFYKTWNLSFVGNVYDTEAAVQGKTLTIPLFHGTEERAAIEQALDLANDYSSAPFFTQHTFVTFEKRAYLPNALFLMLGRFLGMPFHIQFMFGKLGNLLMYCLICALAIRLSRKGKSIICAVSMMPIGLFTAAQYSYDPMVNCFLILYCSLLINEFTADRSGKEKISPLHMTLMLISLMLGSYCKLVYALFGIPLLFLPSARFHGKKRSYVFKGAVILLMAFLLIEILIPSYGGTNAMDRIANAGDSRVEGTSAVGQLSFMLGNLGTYLGMLFGEIFGRFISWFTGSYPFINFGYMGSASLICTYIWFAIFIFAALFSPRVQARRMLSKKWYAINAITLFVMVCVIWSVLYMSFNPVGNPFIGGVQDRYFIPLFPLAALLFMNGRITLKISEKIYHALIITCSALLSAYCIFSLAFVPFYM